MIKFKSQAITKDQAMQITGGHVTTREEYCEQNATIMSGAFNRGDTDTMAAAGAAWEEHCEPYGL